MALNTIRYTLICLLFGIENILHRNICQFIHNRMPAITSISLRLHEKNSISLHNRLICKPIWIDGTIPNQTKLIYTHFSCEMMINSVGILHELKSFYRCAAHVPRWNFQYFFFQLFFTVSFWFKSIQLNILDQWDTFYSKIIKRSLQNIINE